MKWSSLCSKEAHGLGGCHDQSIPSRSSANEILEYVSLKTISFYSYKGGTGRSLLLLNYAKYLAFCGHSTFIIDFDIEAPGLDHKLREFGVISEKLSAVHKGERNKRQFKGVVDYIRDYLEESAYPEKFKEDFVLDFKFTEDSPQCHLMPAGDSEFRGYPGSVLDIDWKKLYPPSGKSVTGHHFFQELRDRIKRDFAPDFLLIDSRTGITHISNEALGTLPNIAVCLCLCSEENFVGTKYLLGALNNATDLKVIPVFARIPSDPKSVQEAMSRATVLDDELNGRNLLMLHEELSLHVVEELRFGSDKALRDSVLLCDYLRLFRAIDEHIANESKYAPLSDDYLTNGDSWSSSGEVNRITVPVRDSISEHGRIFHAGVYRGYANEAVYKNKEDEETKKGNNGLGYKYSDGDGYGQFASCVLKKLIDEVNPHEKEELPIPESDINWDLLSLQIGNRFDFCSELYYLTPYRGLYLDVVRLGTINSITCFVSKNSTIYKEIQAVEADQKIIINRSTERVRGILNVVKRVKEKLNDNLCICLMGESAAADYAVKQISQEVFGNRLLFRRDANELWEWINSNKGNGLVICDHSVAAKMLDLAKCDEGTSTEFTCFISKTTKKDDGKDDTMRCKCDSFPSGYLYPKADAKWRYLINRAVANAFLDNLSIWEKVKDDLEGAGITPLSDEKFKRHLVRGMKPDHAKAWLEKYESMTNSKKEIKQ